MPKGYFKDGTPVWRVRKTSGRPATDKWELFWRHVVKGAADECWEWCGSVSKGGGYGQFWNRNAPRALVDMILGDVGLSANVVVCHKCDNKLCCNPSHLYIGTYSDNAHDRWAEKEKK